MSNFPHYFVAIPLPQHIKDYFSTWQQSLRDKLTYKIWPHKQDLHITLKFLGPVRAEQLLQLQDELRVVENFNPFEINVGTIGTFGNPKKPRVLWAGVEKTEPLMLLQKAVEDCSLRASFPRENRDYNPHITLAKKWAGDSQKGETSQLNSPSAVTLLSDIKETFTEQKTMLVDEVVIYQIFPSRNPKYEVGQTYRLQK